MYVALGFLAEGAMANRLTGIVCIFRMGTTVRTPNEAFLDRE